jgi:hypothetical protein
MFLRTISALLFRIQSASSPRGSLGYNGTNTWPFSTDSRIWHKIWQCIGRPAIWEVSVTTPKTYKLLDRGTRIKKNYLADDFHKVRLVEFLTLRATGLNVLQELQHDVQTSIVYVSHGMLESPDN